MTDKHDDILDEIENNELLDTLEDEGPLDDGEFDSMKEEGERREVSERARNGYDRFRAVVDKDCSEQEAKRTVEARDAKQTDELQEVFERRGMTPTAARVAALGRQ